MVAKYTQNLCFNINEKYNIFQGALPLRFKAIHYYNHGSIFETMMTVIRPFMSEKMKKRVRYLAVSFVIQQTPTNGCMNEQTLLNLLSPPEMLSFLHPFSLFM